MYNKRFCKEPEKIENYQKALADNFKGWDCHHRLETHTSDGIRREVDITRDELKALDMYYNIPADELIFMKHSEHRFLHQKGKHPSEETKNKISEAKKGKHRSEETKLKIGEAQKGKHNSIESRRKMSEAHKGKHHSEESKNKIGEAMKGNTSVRGRHWYNNGIKNIMSKECPDGFVPGRLFLTL